MANTKAYDWDDLAVRVHALVSAPAPAPLYEALWRRLEPVIERWLATPTFLGRVSDDDDLRREILVRTWAKLRDREHGCLRAFTDRPPAGGAQLRGYLYRVVKNLGTDYLRSLPEMVRAPRNEPDGVAGWRQFVEWAPGIDGGGELVVTTDVRGALVRRLLAVLDRAAIDPGARNHERRWYRPALELWSYGLDPDTIAQALDMPDAATAERVVNAAKEFLRRRYRDAA